ncbi:MAG: SDR family oxidoreductase [Planctomycetota bacterium]
MDLSNAIGIITGASSGIGLATTKLLSDAGAKLVITARRTEALTKLASEAKTEVEVVAGDIGDPSLPDRLVEHAVAKFGKLDFVFNNAGIMHVGSVDSLDDESITAMIRVNFEAATRLAYAAARRFKQQGHGDLITTSSILGVKVRPMVGAYAGTKYAVEALSESLRLELAGTGVRVMVIEPGFTKTHLQDHWPDSQKEGLKQITQPVRPEEIAGAVRFMLEQPSHVVIPRLLMVPVEQTL